MSRRTPVLSDADQALWAAYTRMIVPLRQHPAASVENPAITNLAPHAVSSLPASSAPSPRFAPTSALPAPRPAAGPLSVGSQPGGLDSATWKRFHSGKLHAARTLDLHGLTVQRAYHSLVAFLRGAHAERLRCVEIVTGRGNGETGGAIKRELPHWLNRPDIRPLVLGAAHPHALNPGSVRLLLRRIR